jgi:hypothetical protein
MALEIKPTPKLTGEAAKRFVDRARELECGTYPQEFQEAQERLRKSLEFFNNPDSLKQQAS